jgi:hypothetical protein
LDSAEARFIDVCRNMGLILDESGGRSEFRVPRSGVGNASLPKGAAKARPSPAGLFTPKTTGPSPSLVLW